MYEIFEKILIGIALLLFGLTVTCVGIVGSGIATLLVIGFGISIFGLATSLVGYFLTEDDTE